MAHVPALLQPGLRYSRHRRSPSIVARHSIASSGYNPLQLRVPRLQLLQLPQLGVLAPPYLDFKARYVSRLMPCFFSRCVTGTTASSSLRIATICDSVNHYCRIEMPPEQAPRKSTTNCLRDRGDYQWSNIKDS